MSDINIGIGDNAEPESFNGIELAAELTMAWLSNPNTRAGAEDVPAFLKSMHEAVSALVPASPVSAPVAEAVPEHVPAVTVRKSLASKDHIISLIDGKPYRTLRRHLSSNGLTPDEYRERYGLKADYPMVAESYSEARRAMAKSIGLGRKPGQAAPTKVAPKPAASKVGARKSVSAAKSAARKHLGGNA